MASCSVLQAGNCRAMTDSVMYPIGYDMLKIQPRTALRSLLANSVTAKIYSLFNWFFNLVQYVNLEKLVLS